MHAVNRKLAPYAENICEAGIACLLTMVQGNVLALTFSHWFLASQTGLIAGAIVGTTVIVARLRQPWIVSLVLGAATTAVDAFVHPATFGLASLTEAIVTGVGAFVLSLGVTQISVRLRRERAGRRVKGGLGADRAPNVRREASIVTERSAERQRVGRYSFHHDDTRSDRQ